MDATKSLTLLNEILALSLHILFRDWEKPIPFFLQTIYNKIPLEMYVSLELAKQEKWKVFDIVFHNNNRGGNYNVWEVSTLGNFRCNGKVRKPRLTEGGYLVIKNRYAHRIVAETFINNTENKPCVDHINGDKTDNRIENLQWVTHYENNNNPITKSRLIESQHNSTKYKNRKGWNYDHRGENNPNYKGGKNVR